MILDDDATTTSRRRPIHLALQGGGAHGALTWGVLDRLLEDGRLEVKAVSGASAGAMNAVVLADGYARGGPAGAREALEAFWAALGSAARMSPMRRGLIDRLRGRYSLDGSPGYLLLEGLTRLVSPRALNPLGLNPLRDIVAAQVDFERVNAGPIAVHVAATEVETGLPRVFGPGELSVDAVMASACLPQLYPAVEIDGVAYWDGGYSANPALAPLLEDTRSRDILVVQINPSRRTGVPRTAREIADRANEIGFNAPLLKELAALAPAERGGRLRLHRIEAAKGVATLAASGKLDADWDHLRRLFEHGRENGGRWLEANLERVGRAATFGPGSPRPRRWRRLRRRAVVRLAPLLRAARRAS